MNIQQKLLDAQVRCRHWSLGGRIAWPEYPPEEIKFISEEAIKSRAIEDEVAALYDSSYEMTFKKVGERFGKTDGWAFYIYKKWLKRRKNEGK